MSFNKLLKLASKFEYKLQSLSAEVSDLRAAQISGQLKTEDEIMRKSLWQSELKEMKRNLEQLSNNLYNFPLKAINYYLKQINNTEILVANLSSEIVDVREILQVNYASIMSGKMKPKDILQFIEYIKPKVEVILKDLSMEERMLTESGSVLMTQSKEPQKQSTYTQTLRVIQEGINKLNASLGNLNAIKRLASMGVSFTSPKGKVGEPPGLEVDYSQSPSPALERGDLAEYAREISGRPAMATDTDARHSPNAGRTSEE